VTYFGYGLPCWGIFNFLPLICLALAQLPLLCAFLRFCHCIDENFTDLDILHAWLTKSPVQRGSGTRKDFPAPALSLTHVATQTLRSKRVDVLLLADANMDVIRFLASHHHAPVSSRSSTLPQVAGSRSRTSSTRWRGSHHAHRCRSARARSRSSSSPTLCTSRSPPCPSAS
jgi:hypothetical protein